MSPSHATRILFAILAIAFFATPVTARMVGITAEAFENRRFAEAPKPSQGWDAFQQTTRFLTDRMPLRAQAVRANTRIWQDLFDTDPRYSRQTTLADDQALPFTGQTEDDDGGSRPATASQVLSGKDRWLFLTGELSNACTPPLPFDEVLRRWADLVAVVRASGRRAVVLVAPDKASVYPEFLPDEFSGDECALAGKRALWDLLEQRGPGLGVVPLRERLLRAKRRGDDLVYLRRDSHWNALGALEPLRAVLDRFGGAVRIAPGELRPSSASEYRGDLTALLGATDTDTQPGLSLVREPDARRVPGDTLLLGDSYGELSVPKMVPYFEALRAPVWVGTPAKQLMDEIAGADLVIFETVERDIGYRVSDAGPASPAFTAALRRHLMRSPASKR